MWSNFLDSRQPPGTKALHSISVMDWFLQEAKLMQSISVIQLVSASHSSQSRWHQPGSTEKTQGKCASLMLASWSSPEPGFEETFVRLSQDLCSGRKLHSALGVSNPGCNLPASLFTALFLSPLTSHFNILTKRTFLLLPFMHRQHISLLLILIICSLGVPCFVHTRSAFCRQGNWLNSPAKPPREQEHGSHSESPLAGHKAFANYKQTKSTSGTLSKNSSGDPTAVTASTATASKIRQNFNFP